MAATSKPLRVVFLTHNYPRFAGDVAGAFLHPLALALRSRGVDLRVVAPSDEGYADRGHLDGVPIRRVRYAAPRYETLAYRGTMAEAVRTPQGLRALAGMIRGMRRAVLHEGVGAERVVVHAHWWIPAGLASPRALPMVLTCHGTDVRLIERKRAAKWLSRGPLRRARVVTTVSHSLANSLLKSSGITIPDDCIQPMPVLAIPRPFTTGGGGLLVLGRLTEQKRVDLAIDAFAYARTRGLGLPLTIAGDGPVRATLEERVQALGLRDAVTFLGTVEPSRVPQILATADLCLMLAREEGLGLAAAESLLQGVPVVACNDGGGLVDMVPATGAGRIVTPTVEAIAAGVMELVADTNAPEAARTAGMQWRERLSPDTVAERCMVWYARALNA